MQNSGDNWYLLFPGYICTIFESHFERYAEDVIKKAGNNFKEASKELRKPIKKILKHFVPKLEKNLNKLDLYLDDMSQKIVDINGIEELKTSTASPARKQNIKKLAKNIVNNTMKDVEIEIKSMKNSLKVQSACNGFGILLNMYAFVSFGYYKISAGEEGDICNWKFEEFTGIGVQFVSFGDDVLALGKNTNMIRVIPGSQIASTMKVVSKTAMWLGVIQSSIQAVTSVFDEDWKNALLNGSAIVGGLMMIGGGLIKAGLGLEFTFALSALGVPLQIIGGLILLAATIIQFYSLWESKTEKLCRHFLIKETSEGGCNKFEKYKIDFIFGASHSARGLKYNTYYFGKNIKVLDLLVERVINFVNDYDTYDLYNR